MDDGIGYSNYWPPQSPELLEVTAKLQKWNSLRVLAGVLSVLFTFSFVAHFSYVFGAHIGNASMNPYTVPTIVLGISLLNATLWSIYFFWRADTISAAAQQEYTALAQLHN